MVPCSTVIGEFVSVMQRIELRRLVMAPKPDQDALIMDFVIIP